MVFVWMGDGEPAPIEEGVPPELFEADERTTVFHTIRYWHCNWMIALENTLDSHNCFWGHRNAIIQLRNRFGGRPRTPLGYRTKIVNHKAAVVADRGGAANYYAKDGTVPYQMYYPRTGGYWPPTRFRLLWIWFFEWCKRTPFTWGVQVRWAAASAEALDKPTNTARAGMAGRASMLPSPPEREQPRHGRHISGYPKSGTVLDFLA
jgi:hypothetical protein